MDRSDSALSDRTVSHYRILRPLGAGGMGEVYAGFDETLKRRVALKAIRAEHRLSEHTKTRPVSLSTETSPPIRLQNRETTVAKI